MKGPPLWFWFTTLNLGITLMLIFSLTPVIEEVYINTTVYVNNTIYKEIPVIEYVDKIIECNPIECVQQFDPGYVSNLLRDINVCTRERNFLNNSHLLSDYYNLNISLYRCQTTIDDIEELIEVRR